MNHLSQNSLIDRRELIERYPAFGAKKYRLDWLIRRRAIPLIRINRNIYFNPKRIDEFLRQNEIKAGGNG